MAVLLSVRNLSKSFNAVPIANAIDFDVSQGEVLGVIGPNGAGKTTLFGMLSGHVPPTKGRLVFADSDITDLAPHERARAGIARTYQVPRPFSQMTVLENLRVAAQFAAQSRGAAAKALIDEALAITGLADYAHVLAGSLPLLTRKRHELARALAMRPKLLLIDEVAAGLTEEEVSAFIAMVRRIRLNGTAVIWIEHVIRTMVTATDRLMVLAGGEVLAIGDPKTVMQQPEVKRVYLGA